MHEFLRSIGFAQITNKKQLKPLMDWVIENPDHLSVVSVSAENNLAVAEREVSGHAGVAVVGELDERGVLVPEYYYPYITSTHISSEAHISYEPQSDKDGFIGMCEDFRLGMSLIFNIRNITEVIREEQNDGFDTPYRKVILSALASDAIVLLPIAENERVLKENRREAHQRLLQDASTGDPQAMETLAGEDLRTYTKVMNRLHDTDIFTLVDNFFMPYGMASDRYYFMGRILARQLLTNSITGEKFYRILVDSNGVKLLTAVNEQDIMGVPEIGCRLKCHAWLSGEIKK